MTERQKKLEEMRWIDSRSPESRAFINEYGMEEYKRWRDSKRPMKPYEQDLRRVWGQGSISPVYDEIIRTRNGY